jgi:hypothetical protein
VAAQLPVLELLELHTLQLLVAEEPPVAVAAAVVVAEQALVRTFVHNMLPMQRHWHRLPVCLHKDMNKPLFPIR